MWGPGQVTSVKTLNLVGATALGIRGSGALEPRVRALTLDIDVRLRDLCDDRHAIMKRVTAPMDIFGQRLATTHLGWLASGTCFGAPHSIASADSFWIRAARMPGSCASLGAGFSLPLVMKMPVRAP